jgi:hypothetical protein
VIIRTLILGILFLSPVDSYAQDPDIAYEENVQNKLFNQFYWEKGINNDKFPLNNTQQFGKDFRLKDVFKKVAGCFNGDPWTHSTFRFMKGLTGSFDMTRKMHPIRAISESEENIAIDFQERCLHPKFIASGSDIYSDKGCVCQVQIPKDFMRGEVLSDHIRRAQPLKFTYYKWGYSHYTDLHQIPAAIYKDILVEFHLLKQLVDKLLKHSEMVMETISKPSVSVEGDKVIDTSSFKLEDELYK